MDMLNITQKVPVDEAITNYEYHSYQAYTAGELKYNDECRICIQQQDLLTVPSASELHIQGKFLKQDNTGATTLCKLENNFAASLFEEIRYELGGIVIDRVKNPGIATTMKGYVSLSPNESTALRNAGWNPQSSADYDKTTGEFDICWPLSMIFGFAEDYKKALVNVRQELILLRSSDDLNATHESTGKENGKITIEKITWRIPHVTVSDYQKLKILDIIEKNVAIPIAFRKWELFSYPHLQKGSSFTWVLKSSTFLEKPRFIIFGFQTDRKNNLKKNNTLFDHCKLKNIKLYLNSQSYPYENLNLNYDHNKYALAYKMYKQFQQSYYYHKKITTKPLLGYEDFKSHAPLIVLDCSHQNESVKEATIDARIEIDLADDINDNTAAYCLVLHEHFLSYEPLTRRERNN